MKNYRLSCPPLDSLLSMRDDVWHESVTDALAALARVDGGRSSDDYATRESCDGYQTLVYHTEDEADRYLYDDGSHCVAMIIETDPSA